MVGLFTLLIACLNFMNLATARSANRAREVGLRKVVGRREETAHRSIPGRGASLRPRRHGLVGLDLVRATIPVPEQTDGRRAALAVALLSFRSRHLGRRSRSRRSGGGFLSGRSSCRHSAPSRPSRGRLTRGRKSLVLRTALVIVQFSISSALIVRTLFMHEQFRFMKSQRLGFDKEQKLVVPFRGANLRRKKLSFLKNTFLRKRRHQRRHVLVRSSGTMVSNFAIKLVGEADDKNQSMFHLYFDDAFVPLYGISMAAGRAFQKEHDHGRGRRLPDQRSCRQGLRLEPARGSPGQTPAYGQRRPGPSHHRRHQGFPLPRSPGAGRAPGHGIQSRQILLSDPSGQHRRTSNPSSLLPKNNGKILFPAGLLKASSWTILSIDSTRRMSASAGFSESSCSSDCSSPVWDYSVSPHSRPRAGLGRLASARFWEPRLRGSSFFSPSNSRSGFSSPILSPGRQPTYSSSAG